MRYPGLFLVASKDSLPGRNSSFKDMIETFSQEALWPMKQKSLKQHLLDSRGLPACDGLEGLVARPPLLVRGYPSIPYPALADSGSFRKGALAQTGVPGFESRHLYCMKSTCLFLMASRDASRGNLSLRDVHSALEYMQDKPGGLAATYRDLEFCLPVSGGLKGLLARPPFFIQGCPSSSEELFWELQGGCSGRDWRTGTRNSAPRLRSPVAGLCVRLCLTRSAPCPGVVVAISTCLLVKPGAGLQAALTPGAAHTDK